VGYLFCIISAFIFTPVTCIGAHLEVIKLGAEPLTLSRI